MLANETQLNPNPTTTGTIVGSGAPLITPEIPQQNQFVNKPQAPGTPVSLTTSNSESPLQIPIKIGKQASDTIAGISSGDAPAHLTVDQLPQLIQLLGYSRTLTQHSGTSTVTNSPQGYSPTTNYGGFLGGQCTSYASWYFTNIEGKKFIDTSPGSGNAKNWPLLAKQQGYSVSAIPSVGSIVCWPDMGAYGHVAIVQGVNQDGTINVSEMNYHPGQYDTRSNVSTRGAQFIQ